MSDADTTFAAWLRSARRETGLTQQQVADALTAAGTPFRQQQVDKIERGARGIRLHEAVALAEVFGTTVDGALAQTLVSPAAQETVRLRALLGQIAALAAGAGEGR